MHRWISVWLQTAPIPLRSRTLAAAQDGKAYASEFNASPDSVGGAGASSGGHTSMPAAMRPDDPQHTTLSSPDVDDHDGKVAYTIAGSPLLDSYARYQNAQGIENNNLMASTENYFLNEDAMQEGSPQGILERGEDAALPPLLIIQGTADMNIPMSMPHAFVESYRAAGGSVELEEYPDMPHNFILRVGKETDHALGVVKAFVAQPVDGIYRRNACRLTYRVQCRSLSVRWR